MGHVGPRPNLGQVHLVHKDSLHTSQFTFFINVRINSIVFKIRAEFKFNATE